MSNAVLTRLDDERTRLIGFIDETLTRAADEERDLVDAEVRNLASTKERIAAIDDQMKPLQAFEEVRASAVTIDRAIHTSPRPKAPDLRAQINESLGARFTASDQFRTYSGGSGGRMLFEGAPSEVRAPLVSTAPPGSALVANPLKYYAEASAFLTPLLASISRVQVNSGSVDIVTYGDVSGAAVVPEGELKPEAVFGVTVTPTPLETIAATAMASRQLLSDAAQASQFINQQLTRAVLRELEAQVASVIQGAVIPDVVGAAGQDLLGVVRQGIAVVSGNGWNADVLLANPTILSQLDLSILGLGGATAAVIGTGYWGLTPIPVPGFSDSDIYVADSSAAFTLFEKNGVEVFASDSDIIGEGATAQSAFRRNIISFIAELRAVAAVTNSTAAAQLVVTPEVVLP